MSFTKRSEERGKDTRAMYSKLASYYEFLKDAVSLLELAIWKAKINAPVLSHCQIRYQKKAKVCDEISHKEQCRISCGADIVVRNVLPFLWSQQGYFPEANADRKKLPLSLACTRPLA